MSRLSAAWKAVQSLRRQTLLLLDLAGNAIGLGTIAVFVALWTGEEQEPCLSDETLSAHAWRSDQKPTWWAKWLRPAIDWMFSRQPSLPEVDEAAGFKVTGHCERAFWKKKLRMYLPKEYRE
jgi:hypothetical protein